MEFEDRIAVRAMDLFDHYAELGEARRATALAALQATDPEVCAALAALLVADASGRDLVSPLAWMSARCTDSDAAGSLRNPGAAVWRSGMRVGAWCIDDVIGIGGMGVVYAAHRADGWYDRDVAIKTIRPELVSPGVLQAFDRERSHLARLEHPAIATLLDAGLAEDGQSWLAMQRVHGAPIDDACDARRLDLRARVALLADACDAVRYAHAHGVLHQDIKPSNLFVDDTGAVRLLDFGLSALLVAQEEGGARIGLSLAYAAPEAVRGAPPSVAIDVHALGVVLYRLLCDDWPRRPASAGWLATDGGPPRRPSALARAGAQAAARARGLPGPGALARALRGDLDAIALRCVQQDPAARYADVAALQADLRAWLDGRPVAARGGGRAYRIGRFVRRHVPVIAAAGVCVLAVGLAVGMTLDARHRREAEAARDAEALGGLFERSLGAAMLSSLGTAPLASRSLLADTERDLRRQAGATRPLLLARGLVALARARLAAGDYARAADLAREAGGLGAGDGLQQARTDAVLAQLANLQARHADAQRHVRDGLAALPDGDGQARALAQLDLRMQLARARWGQGDPRQAIALLDEAVETATRLGPEGVQALAELLDQRGYDRTQLFQLAAAEADLRRGLQVLGDRAPAVASTLRRHLASMLNLAGRPEEAEREASAALEANRRIFGPAHPETGRAWATLGKTLFSLGEPARSREAIDRAIAIMAPQIGDDHPDVAEALVVRGGIAFEEGRLADALADARHALAALERAYGRRHEATLKRRTDLASLLIYGAGDGGHSDAAYREAATLLADALDTGVRQGLPMGYARDEYANALLHLGRVDEADLQARLGIAETKALFGADTGYAAINYMVLMEVDTRRRDHDAADDLGAWLLAQCEPEDKSSYTRLLILTALLENAVGRGDAGRIRSAYRDVERFARRHGFEQALDTIAVPAALRGG